MDSAHSTARDNYRLIVTRRNASEILVLNGGNTWSLPSVEIPPGRRVAGQLTAELCAQWGCRAYCLLVPTLAAGLPHCSVMEATDLEQIPPAGTCWKPLDVATCAAEGPAEDRTVVEKSIKEWAEYRREPSEAPFTRPGWLSELLAWTQEQLTPLGVRLTGSFAQRNASPRFSLIRLETDDALAVWFKATGEPNRHELAVTACLARLFPGSVPEMLGVHAAWNGWLSREAPGRTLGDVSGLAPWLQASENLARLQVQSIGQEAELLESGCMDLRLPRLAREIDPFVDRMRGLMAAQQKQTPARLTNLELGVLGDSLKEACSRLSEISVPDTLGHVDFNPGNIVVSHEQCIFLDWAEACVTNPLITFEYLREHFRCRCADELAAFDSLLAAYVEPWKAVVPVQEMKEAAVFSPLLAVFAYAVGAGARRSPEPSGKSSEGAYFRSLARRMFREAGRIMERSDRCLA
jgi:Phosphotransferase enzyme family